MLVSSHQYWFETVGLASCYCFFHASVFLQAAGTLGWTRRCPCLRCCRLWWHVHALPVAVWGGALHETEPANWSILLDYTAKTEKYNPTERNTQVIENLKILNPISIAKLYKCWEKEVYLKRNMWMRERVFVVIHEKKRKLSAQISKEQIIFKFQSYLHVCLNSELQ